MGRGVLYLVWPGEDRTLALLDRSIASLKKFHPALPVRVESLPAGSTLLDKARMYELSPFDQTLFLDADTVVMGNLDYGFKSAEKHGIACCICECPWARRYPCFKGDAIEYNTGVVFFDKDWSLHYDCRRDDCETRVAEDVFKRWQWNHEEEHDSSSKFMGADGVKTQAVNDQAGFALAIQQTGFNPWVLPLNWNFRHRWQKTVFGPVKIWHDYDDVPESIVRWNERQSKPDAVIQCGRVA